MKLPVRSFIYFSLIRKIFPGQNQKLHHGKCKDRTQKCYGHNYKRYSEKNLNRILNSNQSLICSHLIFIIRYFNHFIFIM